jgi:hypothetical protein
MVVQAYWVECFEARIASIRLDNPSYTNPEARMAALKEACNTLGWQEKDLRNKMYAPLRFPSQLPLSIQWQNSSVNYCPGLSGVATKK